MVRFFLVILLACAGASAFASETVFPPGSRIGLIPPKDMAPSKRFTGFENPAKGASITLMEMPAEAFEQVTSGLTKEALKAQGLTVTSRENLTLGDKKAVLVAADQPAGNLMVRKWLLAMADPSMTAYVIAQSIASKESYSEAQMRDALKSVALRQPLSIDEQMAALSFRLGDRAGFRPVRVLAGNSLLLTEGPDNVVKDMEQPILVLASSVGPPPPPGEGREFLARAALTSNPTLKDIAIERSQSFRLKGADWHEIVARATDSVSGRPIVVMQTLRFSSDGYLRMVGVARAEAREAMLPRFRAVVDTVEAD